MEKFDLHMETMHPETNAFIFHPWW